MPEIALPTEARQKDIQEKVLDIQTKVSAAANNSGGFNPFDYTYQAFKTWSSSESYAASGIVQQYSHTGKGYLSELKLYLDSAYVILEIIVDGVKYEYDGSPANEKGVWFYQATGQNVGNSTFAYTLMLNDIPFKKSLVIQTRNKRTSSVASGKLLHLGLLI